MRRGDYSLGTFFHEIENDKETFRFNGNEVYSEHIGLVLENKTAIRTALLDYDVYLENYLKAFAALSTDKVLRIDDSACIVETTGMEPLAIGSTKFLSRLTESQAYLLPGANYVIESSNNLLTARNSVSVRLSFTMAGETRSMVLYTFIEPHLSETGVVPYVLRLKNFFGFHVGMPLVADAPIPAILDASNLNRVFELLHGRAEKPVFEKGKVYVLDGVAKRNPRDVYLFYHEFKDDDKVKNMLREDKDEISHEKFMELQEYQRKLRIETFPNIYGSTVNTRTEVSYDPESVEQKGSAKDDLARISGRTQNEIEKFFKNSLDKNTRLFSPIHDIYNNSMDYMKSPLNGYLPQPLLFNAYLDGDRKKLEENARMLRNDALDIRRSYKVYNKNHEQIPFPNRVP